VTYSNNVTRGVRQGSSAVEVIIKDTVTVEDIALTYARTAAVNKLGTDAIKPNIPANIRSQITRVPYVR
jgi:hypothetical protein